MDDPIAFFITWSTYGTWLPGDERGWVEYHRGWQLPDPVRELEALAKMTEDACRLSADQRVAVESQVAETCLYRKWHLWAVNCRSNHIHCVVSARDVPPKKVRSDLKAWATRCLKANFDPERENWWAERGSIRWVFDEESLDTVVVYVKDGQDRKGQIATPW
jgi:REP element-mobilizing transposase RayT